jgi:hypothetical protein
LTWRRYELEKILNERNDYYEIYLTLPNLVQDFDVHVAKRKKYEVVVVSSYSLLSHVSDDSVEGTRL